MDVYELVSGMCLRWLCMDEYQYHKKMLLVFVVVVKVEGGGGGVDLCYSTPRVHKRNKI